MSHGVNPSGGGCARFAPALPCACGAAAKMAEVALPRNGIAALLEWFKKERDR